MKYKNNHLTEISFPLGGIGSGCIGLAGNGRLVDWEIFNKPSKGSVNGYSHFAIKAIKNNKPKTLILNGDLTKDLIGQYHSNYGFGPSTKTMCSFPHFRKVEFNGEFPIAELNFSDESFPATVKMTAFNPFIPGDSKNSSIPAAFFEFEVNNTDSEELTYHIAFSVSNPYKSSRNVSTVSGKYRTLQLINAGDDAESINYGDLTVATDCENSNTQTYWYRSGWQDDITTFWHEFNSAAPLNDRTYSENGYYENSGKRDTGTIEAIINVKPGESKTVKFVLSWNAPTFHHYWDPCKDANGKEVTWKNYYATVWENSLASAKYSLEHFDNLYNRTLRFKNLLHSSSFSNSVIDAASANLSVLKSPTVLRLEDGSFYGFEGSGEDTGICEGTCQHVWNYAYALCFLFPDLERSIRENEFKYATDENGKSTFRLTLPLGREMGDFRACLDGQMGMVIKMYREWKLSGDNEWLKSNWDNIKKVLEYAWNEKNPDAWDLDKDGVLEGRQHHTLDMELFGPSSWLEGMYLTALKAAAEMAQFLGYTEKAEEYTKLFESGKKWTKDNLFNGKYFIQKIDFNDKNITDKFDASDVYWNDETNEIKYQIGEGSSIDQLLGQWHADILGLGDIFDKDQTSTALDEMMKNNFKSSMRNFPNPYRVFSLNDEGGSIICVYPEDANKPTIPIPYCEETMTGFEYSFAGLLCSQGKIKEGETVIKAIRDRFNGKNRNPWNEFECGNNYARSMASYALIPILSGFEFDLPHKYIGFKPYKTTFNSIWSVEGAWGKFACTKKSASLAIEEGGICLSSFGAKFAKKIKSLKIDGESVDFKFENGIIYFDETTINNKLEIKI